MIDSLLTHYSKLINEYLNRIHRHPEAIAVVGRLGGSDNMIPNKMVVSLLNVERETTVSSLPSTYSSHGGGYEKLRAPLFLNLNIVLAVVYEEEKYAYSLSVLSDALRFIHASPVFTVDGIDYSIEIMNITMQDLNNVWTVLGGRCYPAVFCKIRRLSIGGGEILSGGKSSERINTGVNDAKRY